MQERKITLLDERPAAEHFSLSVSKLKTFKDCKAKFHYSYIEKMPKKDWEHLTFGKFIHEVLETFHRELITGSTESFSILMTKHFQAALKNWGEKLSVESKREGFQMLSGYIQQMETQKVTETLPNVLEVEKHFYVDIDGKVLLNGFIDRIQLDTDGMLHISDYKTTKKKDSLKKDFLQLLTYAYVMRLIDPSLTKIRASYILLRHNFEMIVKEFDLKQIMTVEDKFLDYADKIQTEKLFRPNPTPLCGWCDYKEICPEGQRFLGSKTPSFGPTGW